MQSLARWMGILLSGGLLSFAHAFRTENFSRTNSWWTWIVASFGLLLFLSLTPHDRSGLRRFFKGFAGGFIFFSITLYWVINALTVFGGISLWLSVIIASLLWAYCALYMGAWAWIAGVDLLVEKSPFVNAIAWASLWTSLEVLRQFLFSGFHWGELGYHFDYLPWIRESASIWGAHGLTFFWVFMAALVLQIDQVFKDRHQKISLAIVAGIFIFGVGLVQLNLKSRSEPSYLKMGLLQPDIPQSEKWDPSQIAPITEKLLTMTEKSIADGAQIVIWPETSYPRLIGATQRQLPFSASKPIVLGAVVRDGAINRNSAILIEKDQILQRFDKIHLVPFGEYVPLQDWLPFKKLVANVGDFQSGAKDQALLNVPGSSLKLGPLICYEDIFNRSSTRLARAGANVLVNITNDAWYGHSSALEQHMAMSAFQTYQTFLPLVRATNNGVTSIVTPKERVDFPHFTEHQALVSVPAVVSARPTFFVWTYPLMEWIWLFIFAIAAGWKRSQTKKIFFR